MTGGRCNIWAYILAFVVGLSYGQSDNSDEFHSFPLFMPNVSPKHEETYLCTPFRIDPSREYYVTAFEPNATMHIAHHMLLFGCSEPGSSKEVWNCGEMAGKQPGIPSAPTCKRGNQVIYAWAKDAPKLVLPEDVAFKLGGKSDIQYLVLQVHYASVEKFKDGSTDNSGVILTYTKKPQPKTAGVLMLGTGGRILPNSVEYMESACSIQENVVIHPFAFRVHTHSLGRVVSGYKIKRDGPYDEWFLIGKKDPQLPQMFYPVEDKEMILSRNDAVAARCTMESTRQRVTRIGTTSADEMCNFYIMFWTKGQSMKTKRCFSRGPPFFTWDSFGLKKIPNDDASSLPYKETAVALGYNEASFR